MGKKHVAQPFFHPPCSAEQAATPYISENADHYANPYDIKGIEKKRY
jgi:hypothetical protein